MSGLADIRTFYAPDLPGYGDSPPQKHAVCFTTLANLIIEFADAMGLEQFDLNGHSFSASLAAHIAARKPTRVRRLVLTCPGAYRSETERKVFRIVHHVTGVWMAMRRPWMIGNEKFYRFMARPFFYRIPQNAALLREIFDDFFAMDRDLTLKHAISAADPGYNEVLQQITIPTLIVGSRNDKIMPIHGPPHIAKKVPGGQIIWIEECGHLPMIERPDVYHTLVRSFLNGGHPQGV